MWLEGGATWTVAPGLVGVNNHCDVCRVVCSACNKVTAGSTQAPCAACCDRRQLCLIRQLLHNLYMAQAITLQ
jgi:hypothetical protein